MHRLLAILLVLLMTLAGGPARADTIKVLTTGAFKQVLMAMVPAFEASTGHKVQVQNDTAGALVRRVDAGETFDLIVLTPGGLKPLAERGKVEAASVRPLARAAIGVAIMSGRPAPPLTSVEDFKQAVLAARKVAYIDPAAGGSSGIYLDGLFQRLGLADAVRAKAVLVPGGLVAERLVKGEADLVIHQISEILPVQGVTLVGPLPEAIQNYTTYAGAVAAQAPEAARAFLNTLTSTQADAVIRAKGMLPAR